MEKPVFLRLTAKDDGTPLLVNVTGIDCFLVRDSGAVSLEFKNCDSFIEVTEKMETIDRAIRAAGATVVQVSNFENPA